MVHFHQRNSHKEYQEIVFNI